MKIRIDRFEGNYAVAELPDGSFENLPKIFLENCKEGDIVNITVDSLETDVQKREIKNKLNKIFNK